MAKNSDENDNEVMFNVVDIADALALPSGAVKKALKALQWISRWKKTGIMVDLQDLSFQFRARGDLTLEELDDVIDLLWTKVERREHDQIHCLQMLSDSLQSVSYKSYWMCSDDVDEKRSDKLKGLLMDYFQRDHGNKMAEDIPTPVNPEPDSTNLHQLRLDIGQFVSLYGHDHRWTARAVARVFHGIGSPCFPADVWGRVRRFWRSHLDVCFNIVLREARDVLIGFR